MSLLVVFFVMMGVGDAIAVGISLLVEHFYERASIFVFFTLFFAVFWLAWQGAVKFTDRWATD
jgi:hypothetical protein